MRNTCGITYSNTMFDSVYVRMVFMKSYCSSGLLRCHLAILSGSRIREVILKLIHTMQIGSCPITNENQYPICFNCRKNRKLFSVNNDYS